MTDSDKVWMPDTFFRNEKIGRFHKILQPNLYVRVFPDGDVLYRYLYIDTLIHISAPGGRKKGDDWPPPNFWNSENKCVFNYGWD